MLTKSIYRLKAKYGTLIRIPLEVKGGSVKYTFRRFKTGEWLDFYFDMDNPSKNMGILYNLFLDEAHTDDEIELLDNLLTGKPGYIKNILSTIGNQSSFNDVEHILELYHSYQDQANVSLIVIAQMITEAYPSYRIEDIMNFTTEELMRNATWAEVKLGKPYYIEFLLEYEEYAQKYIDEILGGASPQDFSYQYENHLTYKHYLETGDIIDLSAGQSDDQGSFLAEDGRMLPNAQKEEYQLRKLYYKEILRRRKSGMPNIPYHEFLNQLESDPNMEKKLAHMEEDRELNLTNEAASVAKNHLAQRLKDEKNKILNGQTKRKTFDWEKDSKIDINLSQ